MRNLKKFLAIALLAAGLGVVPSSHATISTTTNQTITANGNGVTVNYTIGYTFRDNDDILVYLEDTSVTPHTRTLKTYGGGAGQYTITGGDPGTTVHMGTAPASTERLVIKRNSPRSQTVDYDETQAFPAQNHEDQLDKMTMVLQELDSKIDTKVGLASGTTSSTPTFPEPVASTYLRYDGSALMDTRTYAQVLSDISALKTSNNLSDLTNVATALLNLGISSTNSLPILGSNGEVLTIAGGILDYAQIVNANVSSSAAIDYSKLNLTGAILNADLAGSIADTKLSTIATAGKVSNSATTAASANTASAIVARDGSGNFVAGTITANLTGNVTGNASTATALAANPTACSAGNFVTDIAADGTLTCSTPAGAGDFVGPASSHDNAAMVFSGTTGKLGKEATFTQHNVLTAGANNVFSSVAPSTAGKVLVSDGTDWTSALPPTSSFTAPTLQKFTATGTQTGWLFTISTSSTLAVGDTYTNNGNTYTVRVALTAQTGQVLWTSGTGATSGGTLTKAVSAAGPATITFSAKVATATYTTATSPRTPLYLEIELAGGGGGGGNSGTAAAGNGTAGTLTGLALATPVTGDGGAGGAGEGNGGGAGGAIVLGSLSGMCWIGGAGGSGHGGESANSVVVHGATGGSTFFGGFGQGGDASNPAGNAVANTGGGGGGGGVSFNAAGAAIGSGGGAGGYCRGRLASPAANYDYVIGTKGTGATLGTNGRAGGDGADGILMIWERYQ